MNCVIKIVGIAICVLRLTSVKIYVTVKIYFGLHQNPELVRYYNH